MKTITSENSKLKKLALNWTIVFQGLNKQVSQLSLLIWPHNVLISMRRKLVANTRK